MKLHDTGQKIAVLLVNLGTPDEPTAKAVKRYLRQFLSDQRVVELPRFLWTIILNLVVLPLRSKRVADAYAQIWQTDSPIRAILRQQADKLNQHLQSKGYDQHVLVRSMMTYGNPSIVDTLDELKAKGVDHFVILPLFPQYSATSTGAVYDAITRWLNQQRDLPSISIIKSYHDSADYLAALTASIERFQAAHGQPEKLLFSFHGIPKVNVEKGDPYEDQCRYTASQVASKLGLDDDQWLCAFQSRFGKQEWLKPYTDEVLKQWASQNIDSVQVISPAFSADCLETLEELMVENRDNYLQAGGSNYQYIKALNDDDAHITMMANLVIPHLDAWLS